MAGECDMKKVHTKLCKKCGIVKPFAMFDNRANQKDGKDYYCKDCKKEIKAQYYLDNKSAILGKTQKYRRDHKGAFKIYRDKWEAKNPEYRKRYRTQWYRDLKIKNPEKYNLIQKQKYTKDKECGRTQKQSYKEGKRRYEQKAINQLTDTYIKKLTSFKGVPRGNIPNDLIEVTRMYLKIKRIIKQQPSL